MNVFIPGQRWISESEPELGLGTVVPAEGGRVKVEFKAAGETRIYAAEQVPLKRVRFRAGEKIKTQTDKEFVIKEVAEQNGFLTWDHPMVIPHHMNTNDFTVKKSTVISTKSTNTGTEIWTRDDDGRETSYLVNDTTQPCLK